jgi:hypothetical protein
MDARVIGARSDAVLWTAKPGHDRVVLPPDQLQPLVFGQHLDAVFLGLGKF